MVRGLRGSGALLAAATAFSLLALTQPASADAARDQWYLGQFNSTELWQTTKGAGIVVAEVGSGVDSVQVDIAANVRDEVDVSKGYAVSGKGDLSKTYDGTQVAALIVGTGQGSAGVEGLAPNATLMSIRALAAGQTTPASFPVSVGIKYAVDHGARVIVLPIPLIGTSDAVKSAVQYAVSHNVVVVASAGNNGKANVLSSPCTAPGVLCVSGLTKTGTLWPTSSSGSAIDLAAPAEKLPVPLQNGSVAINSSTHYSAALAAAEAVLVTSAHPDWTAGQVIRAMIGNTTGGNSGHTRVSDGVGYGTMNPLAAVKAAAPAETTNPFLPIALSTASASASAPASPKATHSTAAVAAAHNSGGGSSTVWLAAGGAAAAAILGVALVWFLIRRRTTGNYLTDPAYGAGSSFLQPDGSPLYYDPQPTYQQPSVPQHQQPPPPPFQPSPPVQPQPAPEPPVQQQAPESPTQQQPQPHQQAPDAYPPLPDWYEQEPPADPGWPAQGEPGAAEGAQQGGEGPAQSDAHSPDSTG